MQAKEDDAALEIHLEVGGERVAGSVLGTDPLATEARIPFLAPILGSPRHQLISQQRQTPYAIPSLQNVLSDLV